MLSNLPATASRILTEDLRRVLSNFFSLSVLQAANILLPLMTFPYLVQVIGIENFGLLSFATATILYFETLTDYGFDLSATRQISIHRNDPAQVAAIFSSVITIKAILALISLSVLTLLIITVERFSTAALIFYLTFGRVIGKAIFPVWFFQGLEKMGFSTALNLLSKIFFVAGIFIFVRSESDLLLAAAFQPLGFLVAGLLAMIQIRFGFGVRYTIPSWQMLMEHLHDGWHVFVSRVFVNLYTATNLVMLGLFAGNLMVGQYAVASKILEALSHFFGPLNDALFPFMSKLYHDSREQFRKLVRRLNIGYLIAGLTVTALAWIFGDRVIAWINGSADQTISFLFLILSLRLLAVPFSSLYTSILINQNRKADYLRVVRNTFLANIVLVPPAIWFWGTTGMALVSVAVSAIHIGFFLLQGLNGPEIQQPADFKN